jgi:hypothetical protein
MINSLIYLAEDVDVRLNTVGTEIAYDDAGLITSS